VVAGTIRAAQIVAPSLASRACIAIAQQIGDALAAERSTKSSSKAAAELDPTIDASLAAIVPTLEARAKLVELACAKEAQEISDRVFPDRLKVTQEKYVRQWSIANAKLQQLLAEVDGGRCARQNFFARMVLEIGSPKSSASTRSLRCCSG
jgi:hypothetical protein